MATWIPGLRLTAVPRGSRAWTSTVFLLAMVVLGSIAGSLALTVTTTLVTNPLGLDSPERVVVYRGAHPTLAARGVERPEDLVDYKAMLPGVQYLAAYSQHDVSVNLSANGTVIRARGAEVSAEFFSTLGVTMAHGRAFSGDDFRPGNGHVVVLSDELYRRVSSGSARMSGITVTLNRTSFDVIGVARPGLRFPNRAEFWVPVSTGANRVSTGPAIFYQVFGRLADGLKIEQARSSFEAFGNAAGREAPGSWPTRGTVEIVTLAEQVVGRAAFFFQLAAGALLLVWLGAVANIAALSTARAAARRKEFWTRRVLGASTGRLMKQLAGEGLVLCGLAFGAGMLGAIGSLRILASLLPSEHGVSPSLAPTAATWLFCASLAIVTGSCAVLPACRLAMASAGVAGRRRPEGSIRSSRNAIRMPVLLQVAAAMALVIGSSVVARTLQVAAAQPLGFDPSGVTVASIGVASTSAQANLAVYRQFMDRVGAIDGVDAVGAASAAPLSRTEIISLLYEIDDLPRPVSGGRFALAKTVAGDYFETIDLPVLAGRTFIDGDYDASAPAVVVNARLASLYGDPALLVGRRITLPRGADVTVVGVVGDEQHFAPGEEVEQQIYIPGGTPSSGVLTTLLVQSSRPSSQIIPLIRQIVADVDPTLVVFDATSLEELLRASTGLQRQALSLLAVFAFVALVLAATGVFAALGHEVASRTRELGIRIALGAQQSDIAWMVFGRAAGLATLGVALGALLAFAGGGYVAASQFGVLQARTGDYVLGATTLIVLAMLACAPAAALALRIEPTRLLRSE